MYARAIYTRGDPSQIDAVVAYIRDNVLPVQRQAAGWGGVGILVNRDTGDGLAVTYWETVQAMNAFERRAQELRWQASQELDLGVIDVDRFEVILAHRKGQATAPTFVRFNEVYSDLASLEQGIEFLSNTVLPSVSAQPGFRSLIGAVNRMTGRTVVASNWDSAADRANSAAAAAGQRQQGAQIAGASARVEEFEAVILEIKQSASSP